MISLIISVDESVAKTFQWVYKGHNSAYTLPRLYKGNKLIISEEMAGNASRIFKLYYSDDNRKK